MVTQTPRQLRRMQDIAMIRSIALSSTVHGRENTLLTIHEGQSRAWTMKGDEERERNESKRLFDLEMGVYHETCHIEHTHMQRDWRSEIQKMRTGKWEE